MKRNLDPLPHPAYIVSGDQLDNVIAEMEAGTMPLPDAPVRRSDLEPEQRDRLYRATGGRS